MSIQNCIREYLKRLSVVLNIHDDDLELSYDTDLIEVFAINVQNKIPANPQIESMVRLVIELISDSTLNSSSSLSSYVSIKKAEIKYLSRQKETKYRIRNFVVSSNNGAIIPTKYLQENINYNLPALDKKLIERKIIELLLFFGQPSISQSDFKSFFDKIISPSKNTVIAIYNTSHYDFTRLYSKSFFIYLLKGHKTIFPSEVNHSFNLHSSLIASVNASNNDFTQFFEIYDVMDEYHHANDILVKYLKLYQIIEYLLTRSVLVKIQESSSNHNLFLREMTSLSKLNDFDKSKFKKVFQTNEAELTTWFQSKLSSDAKLKKAVENILYPNESKTITVTSTTEVYSALLSLIYKLRNSIVHNKESEIHLTIHNVLLKKEVIKLIKELLQKLENVIFKKVVDFDNSIKYRDRYLALY